MTSNRSSVPRILVVDDSEIIRHSAEILLQQAGYEVILANDGFDALGKICDYDPSLILIDIMMPKLDGYETCRVVKQNPAYAPIPVIMLSGRDGTFDRTRGGLIGLKHYLNKPFTRDGLLTAVKSQLGAHAG